MEELNVVYSKMKRSKRVLLNHSNDTCIQRVAALTMTHIACSLACPSVRPSIPTDSIQLQLTTLNYVYVTDKKGKDQTTNGCDAAAEQQHQ